MHQLISSGGKRYSSSLNAMKDPMRGRGRGRGNAHSPNHSKYQISLSIEWNSIRLCGHANGIVSDQNCTQKSARVCEGSVYVCVCVCEGDCMLGVSGV